MIDPVAFSIGPLSIRWYGILLALAFFLGYVLFKKCAKERGINPEYADDYLMYMVLGIIVGARLGEIIFYEPLYYLANPLKMLFVWEGGLASHGGIIGGLIATYLFCRKRKIAFYKVADILALVMLIGGVFVRIGNFINGEIVGTITNVPWGFEFQGYEGLRHPSQVYEVLQNGLLFGILYSVRNKPWKEGTLLWLSIGLFSFVRFFLEFMKEGTRYVQLTTGQWLSLLFLIIAIVFLYKLYKLYIPRTAR